MLENFQPQINNHYLYTSVIPEPHLLLPLNSEAYLVKDMWPEVEEKGKYTVFYKKKPLSSKVMAKPLQVDLEHDIWRGLYPVVRLD